MRRRGRRGARAASPDGGTGAVDGPVADALVDLDDDAAPVPIDAGDDATPADAGAAFAAGIDVGRAPARKERRGDTARVSAPARKAAPVRDTEASDDDGFGAGID